MRNMTIYNVPISLSEKDWSTLERRFNLKNAMHPRSAFYTIQKSCICKRYPDCTKCPFKVLEAQWRETGVYMTGCGVALYAVLDGESRAMRLYSPSIEWYGAENKRVRYQINKIHDFLLSLPRRTR